MAYAKLLSRIGVGAATVDTKLEPEEVSPGDEVRGVVECRGGNVEQEVEGIHLEVQTHYKRHVGENEIIDTGTIERFPVSEGITIQPDAHRNLEFSFRLPYDTPFGRSVVWVRTALDVKKAVDPSDNDWITVHPTATIATILEATAKLGFRLRKVEKEELPYPLRRRLPFGQTLEFLPEGGEFRGSLDELEMVVLPSEEATDLILQVDRRASGLSSLLSEAVGADESHVRLTIQDSDAARGADHVAETLGDAIRQRV